MRNQAKDGAWVFEDRYDVYIFDQNIEPCDQTQCLERNEIAERNFKTSKISYTATSVKARLKKLGY